MKTLATAVLTATGFAALPDPAAANWQYTKWNMTPAEVKAASQGAALDNADRGLDAEGRKARLTALYEGEELQFKVVFLFNDEDELKDVTLTPTAKNQCPLILDRLQHHYGSSKANSDLIHADIARWDDFENSNLVVFLKIDQEGCTIQYSNLPPTHSDGDNL